MVISASRRTDIPGFYSDWLMGRVEAGYCLVANPYDAGKRRRVGLAPDVVDFMVLWTRDPRPMLPRMAELDARGLRSYFQFTITGYPPSIEPGGLPLDQAIGALCDLAQAIGARRVLWRYDPVFLAGDIDAEWHLRNFERLAAAFEGSAERVAMSLLDEYAATGARLARAGYADAIFGSPRRGGSQAGQPEPPEPYPALLAALAAIARSRGICPVACAEPFDLSPLGIEAGACVDAGLAASIWGPSAQGAPRAGKDSGQRGACRCVPSVDIGAYGTCPRGCAYCYANRGSGRLLARGREDEAL